MAAGTLYKQFKRLKLKDGRIGTVMDHAGPDYVIDVGESEKDYDTILVKPEEIEKIRQTWRISNGKNTRFLFCIRLRS